MALAEQRQLTVKEIFQQGSSPLEQIDTGMISYPLGLRSRPTKAVFFDVYGTMMLSAAGEIAKDAGSHNSQDPVVLALQAENLQVAGLNWQALLNTIERDHDAKTVAGIQHPEVDIREIWQRTLFAFGIKSDSQLIERLAARCETIANPCWPEPGLKTILRTLFQAKIPVGIISNAQFYTPEMIEALLETPLRRCGFHPNLQVWSYEEGIAKPSPALYSIAAARLSQALGISPQDTIMVGNDIRNDIAPAQAVGFRGVLYAGDKRSLRLRNDDPHCKRIQPDAIITSLAELGAIIQQPSH